MCFRFLYLFVFIYVLMLLLSPQIPQSAIDRGLFNIGVNNCLWQ